MKKGIISIAAAAAITASLIPPAAAEGGNSVFSDVTESHWAYDVIMELTSEGIINGMGDGTFDPEGHVTREQFMKLLVTALDIDIDGVYQQSVTDVDGDSWSAPYIYAGIENGIYSIEGSGAEFYPSAELRRGISAEWIVSGLGIETEAENVFTDVSGNGAEAKAIAEASKIGIVSGYEDNTFRPDNTITRAEAAALIKRVSDYYESRYSLRADAANEIELGDKVEIAESSALENIPVSADADAKTVTFRNADESIRGLESGEILFIQPCENLPDGFLGKVVSVSGGGDTVIKFEEPELAEVVRSIDISTYVSADLDDYADNGDMRALSAVKDVSSADNGVTVSGEGNAGADITLDWGGVKVDAYADANEKANVHFETDSYKTKDGVYAVLDMSLEAKVDIRLETDNLEITRFDASADVLTDIAAVAGYNASVSKEYTYELPSCSIPVAGLFSVVINSSLVVQADGSLNIEATADLSNDMGASFSIDDGFTTYNTTDASAGLTVDAEGSLRMGPREEVELVLCGINVFGKTFFDGVSLLEAEASFGLGASGKTEVDKSVAVSDDGIEYGDEGGLKHLCYFCIEGDIFYYFNGSVGVGEDIQSIVDKIADVDLTYTFADIENKICDWHLSSGEGYTLEFGFTKCPHYEEVVPDVTFSAQIGEINGTIYCSRKASYTVSSDGLTQEQDVPTCTLLPVETDTYTMIAGFAVYDGYIYFIESEGGTSDYRTWLYRCKEDLTGKELLASSDMNGDRDFVIDSNVVYYNGLAIDLSDLSVTEAEEPKYTVTDNGNVYESGYESGYETAIYNGTTFFTDPQRDLYVINEDGSKKFLASDAYIDGGLAGDYLYYAEYDWEKDREAKLYRISLSSGEREFIASRLPAGGGGPYFCW